MPLRPYQQEAVDKTIDYLKNQKGNPVIGMPTASGKSWVIAGLIENMTENEFLPRILKLVHTKELIVQNMDKLKTLLPDCDAGILSSGLSSYKTDNQIVFGGIGTVVNRVRSIGKIDYVITDECHSISDNESSNYQKTFSILREMNPAIRFIGLTATPYRLGKGSIIDNKTWHGFSHNLTSWREFNKLVVEGFLCDLIPQLPKNVIDTRKVDLIGGEFNSLQLQQAVLKNDVTTKALKEAIPQGLNRNKWLVFASGVEHAITCANTLNLLGIKSTVVHSNLSDEERDEAIAGFKSGKYKAIVNNNILTTGFDAPEIDFIIMLRPTMSPVLWVQMLGRGCRPHESKKNCLVLDFAYNTQRLGPINDPVIPEPSRAGGNGDAPVKLCIKCNVYNHISARICIGCGYEFPIQKDIKRFASNDELIRKEDGAGEKWADVINVGYTKGFSSPTINYFQVTYTCRGTSTSIKEMLLFGIVQRKSTDKTKAWWRKRMELIGCKDEVNLTANDWLMNREKLIKPSRIQYTVEMKKNPKTKQFKTKYNILKYEFIINGEVKIIDETQSNRKEIIPEPVRFDEGLFGT